MSCFTLAELDEIAIADAEIDATEAAEQRDKYMVWKEKKKRNKDNYARKKPLRTSANVKRQ